MNPLKLFISAALALAVVSAQNATSTDKEITVTKDQLNEILKEVKAAAANSPDFAAIFASVDLDALMQLTPEQVRVVLNEKVFNVKSNGSSSGSGAGKDTVTTAPPSTDAVSSKTPSVPAPGGSSGASSLAVASVTTFAAGVVVTIYNL